MPVATIEDSILDNAIYFIGGLWMKVPHSFSV